ncbi:hypothetical protein [Methylomicrobium sp. Wu6]|uniref:hypothetical protein n=1 Tax=Methylomicrobium sp. Wu6 TaxID=3107928 RepID=UPI002DD6AC45|nr:hypothetical protein [Methylomicrobium sp. Wu6]MEC4748531.1 hypothetical protein [Methylomicrobium sp. Wu6]
MMRMKKSSTSAEHSPPEQPFPSARYFQIHFQYLHETIGDLRLQVEKANQQIAEMQLQLQLNQTRENARQSDSGKKTESRFEPGPSNVADAAY